MAGPTNIAAAAVGLVGQSNLLLAGVIQALSLYRAARDAWKAAHPAKAQGDGDPGEQPEAPVWLEDGELIGLFQKDSVALSTHAAQLLDKYAAAQPPPPPFPPAHSEG